MRIATLFIVGLLLTSPATAIVSVGDIPPDYLGKTVAGEEIYIRNFEGKVVVTAFWASWCPPCLDELPVLESMQRHVGKEALQIVAINFKENKSEFNRIYRSISEYQLTVTRGSNKVVRSFGVKVLPYLFIIGRDGKVAYIHRGYKKSDLSALVDAINQELLTVSTGELTTTP